MIVVFACGYWHADALKLRSRHRWFIYQRQVHQFCLSLEEKYEQLFLFGLNEIWVGSLHICNCYLLRALAQANVQPFLYAPKAVAVRIRYRRWRRGGAPRENTLCFYCIRARKLGAGEDDGASISIYYASRELFFFCVGSRSVAYQFTLTRRQQGVVYLLFGYF